MPSDQTHYKIRNTKSTEKLDEGSTRKKLQVSQSFRNKQREKLHTKNHMKKCDKMWTTSTTSCGGGKTANEVVSSYIDYDVCV